MTTQPDAPEVLERFHSALDLVEVAARHVHRSTESSIELDDLRSFGREGLLEAARRYDPDRGVPFRAYASFRVRGAVVDGARATGRIPRRAYARLRALDAALRVSEGASEDVAAGPAPGAGPEDAERALASHLAGMATAMAVGLVTTGAGEQDAPAVEAEDPEEAVGRAELIALIDRAIDGLPSDEATLLRRHYFDGNSFEVAARELGLSRSWASRLHARAIGRLEKRLRGTE